MTSFNSGGVTAVCVLNIWTDLSEQTLCSMICPCLDRDFRFCMTEMLLSQQKHNINVLKYKQYRNFIDRGRLLNTRLLTQGYQRIKLASTLMKFYGRHHDLVPTM